MTIRSKDYAGRTCELVHVKTGKPISEGTAVTLRDDEHWQITGGRAPHHPGSTGRVYVRLLDIAESERQLRTTEFFPGVVDAQWVPVTLAAPEDNDTRFMPLI
jgi:hypothetical protein